SSDLIEHIADEVANEEHVPTQSNDPPLLRFNTLGKTTKTAQANEIASLKKRVKKLERKRKSKPPRMKRLFKIGRSVQVVSSEDEEVPLIDETRGRNDDNLMFDTGVIDEQEVKVEKVVSTAEVAIDSATTTTTTPAASKPSHDKGKVKMTEPEKPLKKKDQIMYDQEVALNLQAQLQAELEEEERLTR
ncbi:hypothetical protein Tco_1453705, partial [Tanacetum coccineum]